MVMKTTDMMETTVVAILTAIMVETMAEVTCVQIFKVDQTWSDCHRLRADWGNVCALADIVIFLSIEQSPGGAMAAVVDFGMAIQRGAIGERFGDWDTADCGVWDT
jgi:hypothetical protein